MRLSHQSQKDSARWHALDPYNKPTVDKSQWVFFYIKIIIDIGQGYCMLIGSYLVV